MTTQTILLDIQQGIATITFNRPTQMNTLNPLFAREFVEITERVANDKTIRAVLLQGSGHCFSAGGDISFFQERLDKMPEGVLDIVRQVNHAVLNLKTMAKPVLASVHGAVAGVGLSFMLAADLVIAADDTQFSLAYGKLGITPDGGASYFLPRLVGDKKALELILFAERFDAPTAKAYGLINWCVPGAQLKLEADKILQKLAAGPTRAYANAKKLVQQSHRLNLEQQLELEAESFVELSTSRDFHQGVKAFLQKTKAVFTGE